MAILRAGDIRDMSDEERAERLEDLNLELAKERGQIAVGGFPENPGRIKEIRRTIARIRTIMQEAQEGEQ